jgi:hypothetical protein
MENVDNNWNVRMYKPGSRTIFQFNLCEVITTSESQWRRASGINLTAQGTRFNHVLVRFYLGTRHLPSECNGKLLTYNA